MTMYPPKGPAMMGYPAAGSGASTTTPPTTATPLFIGIIGSAAIVTGNVFKVPVSRATAAGHDIVICSWTTPQGIASIADTAGNSYVEVAINPTFGTATAKASIWWCHDALALSLGDTITITNDLTCNYLSGNQAVALEWKTLAAFYTTKSGTDYNVLLPASVSASITPSAANEVLIAVFGSTCEDWKAVTTAAPFGVRFLNRGGSFTGNTYGALGVASCLRADVTAVTSKWTLAPSPTITNPHSSLVVTIGAFTS